MADEIGTDGADTQSAGPSLNIGSVAGSPFTIDANVMTTGRTCVIGASGSGKSYTVGVLCEELCKNQVPFAIVDVEGEYSGLKEKYEAIWIGEDDSADLKWNQFDLHDLASQALDIAPLIVDVSESQNSKEKIQSLISEIYHEVERRPAPYLIVVEEADRFSPQDGERLPVFDEIARRGRKRGLGLMICTQRPSVVDKNILSQCSNQLIGKLVIRNDLQAVAQFFEGRELPKQLTSIPAGTFYALGGLASIPQRVEIRRRETTHGGITPQLGVRVVRPFIPHVKVPVQTQAIRQQSPSESSTWFDAASKAVGLTESRMPPSSDLEQLVHAPEPYKGYRVRAKSVGFPLSEFVGVSGSDPGNPFINPFPQTLFEADIRGAEIVCSQRTVFLSIVRLGHKLDELGRSGVVAHIVALSRELANRVSFSEVESAIINFQDANGIPMGELHPLHVSWTETPESELARLKDLMTAEKAARLGNILASESPKVVIVSRTSDWRGRINITYSISKFFMGCGFSDFVIASEYLMETPLHLMNRVAVLSSFMPHIRPNSGWTAVSLSAPETSTQATKENIDRTIHEIYK